MDLVEPLVVARRLGAALDGVLDLDVHERLGSAAEAPGGRVVDVGDFVDAQREVAAQGLPLAGDVEAIVCAESACTWRRSGGPRTVAAVALDVHVQVLVALERVLEQLDLLVALDALRLGVLLAAAVALHLVEAHHLLDAVLVLLLDAELELELGQHELDARTQVRRVILDEVCRC